MKTKEELNALKEEVKTLNKKLRELTEDELKQVTGGFFFKELEVTLDASGAENSEQKKAGFDVAFFPGLSGFP